MISEVIGTAVPFADPLWYTTLDSPHYNDSHRSLVKTIRKYVDEELTPNCADWESEGHVPEAVQRRHAQLGYAAASVYPLAKEYIAKAGISLPGGISPDKWDAFHDFILIDELMRCGYLGVSWALGTGNIIGCPPIVNFASASLKDELLPAILRGDKRICLGVTEPDAGSDVAGIKTTARKESDVYVVNGAKKWITNAIYSDYVTAAVRTGGPGHGGISCLVIPLDLAGVTRRKLENSGVNSSGSTFISFEDVRVPARFLVGREGEGFRIFMSNFNHERLWLSIQALRMSRVCVEDAWEHAQLRETFGKKLIEQPIIRLKFAQAGKMIEALQAQLESLFYHFARNYADADLAGLTALAKVNAGRTLELVNRECQQVFGGLGYQRNGPRGARVEQISRDLRVIVVGGGSEEILIDLGMRQQMRIMGALATRGKSDGKKVQDVIPPKL
ncbi:hypothetical protein PYCC9005_002855 [Savitreella phatthalungensis]